MRMRRLGQHSEMAGGVSPNIEMVVVLLLLFPWKETFYLVNHSISPKNILHSNSHLIKILKISHFLKINIINVTDLCQKKAALTAGHSPVSGEYSRINHSALYLSIIVQGALKIVNFKPSFVHNILIWSPL